MDKKYCAPILAMSCLIMALWSSGKSIIGYISKVIYTAASLLFILSFLKDAGVISIKFEEGSDE